MAGQRCIPSRKGNRARETSETVAVRSDTVVGEQESKALPGAGNIAGFPAGVGFRQDTGAPFPWPAAEGSDQGPGSSPLFGGTPQTSSPIM